MQDNSKFTKKIKIKGPDSLPKARAARLKKLRNMANLSRKEICDKYELNVNTYKGWEIARYGGLPLDGAKKTINRVAEEGIICSLNWLLHGEGEAPTIIAFSKEPAQISTETNVLKEILVFKSLSQNTIFTEVMDDGMTPPFNIGDYVAGEKKTGKEIESLLNYDCIVQLIDSEILVRKLKKGNKDKTYTLICTNSETSIEKPILYDMKLAYAARITRHYIK